MNLYEILANELKDMHLNDFEKARYIYLRCCQIFSFDTRLHYTDLFNDTKLEEKIINKKFDLENIDSHLVVCHSFSKSILKPLIEYFTDLRVELHEGGHSYVMLYDNNVAWKLDATVFDLARVKMNFTTDGFISNYVDHKKILKEIDQKLKYVYKYRSSYSDKIKPTSFLDIILSVSKMLEDSKCKYHYSDASHFYTTFASLYNNEAKTYVDDNYNFNKLMSIVDDYSYFRLHKIDNEYKLDQIDEEEYKTLKRTLKSNNIN